MMSYSLCIIEAAVVAPYSCSVLMRAASAVNSLLHFVLSGNPADNYYDGMIITSTQRFQRYDKLPRDVVKWVRL